MADTPNNDSRTSRASVLARQLAQLLFPREAEINTETLEQNHIRHLESALQWLSVTSGIYFTVHLVINALGARLDKPVQLELKLHPQSEPTEDEIAIIEKLNELSAKAVFEEDIEIFVENLRLYLAAQLEQER